VTPYTLGPPLRKVGEVERSEAESSAAKPANEADSPSLHTSSRNTRFVRLYDYASRRACSPLGYLDISRRNDIHALRVSGCVIEVRRYRAAALKTTGHSKKSQIREWSLKSRKNCVRTLAACALPDFLDMITLTYPGIFPCDGQIVHRDLEALLDRLQRRFGAVPLIWKLEFQRRGAPHLMIFLQRPLGVWIGERQSWVERAWAGVLQSNEYEPPRLSRRPG
jgi:hypothetical protein